MVTPLGWLPDGSACGAVNKGDGLLKVGDGSMLVIGWSVAAAFVGVERWYELVGLSRGWEHGWQCGVPVVG